ncbi:hypothetical protein CDAR_260021, partial [Caerostris darwini]
GTQKVRRRRRDSDHDDSLRRILLEDGITAGTTPATYLTPGGAIIGGEFVDVKNGAALITDEPTDVVELEKMIEGASMSGEIADSEKGGSIAKGEIGDKRDHSEDVNLKKRIVEIETLQSNKNLEGGQALGGNTGQPLEHITGSDTGGLHT